MTSKRFIMILSGLCLGFVLSAQPTGKLKFETFKQKGTFCSAPFSLGILTKAQRQSLYKTQISPFPGGND